MIWHRVETPETTLPCSLTLDGRALMLVYVEGRWWVLEDRCSHANCAFSEDGEIDGHTAVCNCHGSEFDVRTGEVLAFPAADPIQTFPVMDAGDHLEVEL